MAALLGALPGAATATSLADQLAHCASLENAPARLACYDGLAGRKAAGAPPPLAAADPVATGAAPSRAASDAEHFGREDVRARVVPAGPLAIHAHIAQVSADLLRRYMVVLDNGQVWAVIDGEVQANPGDPVTIRRAALGSFLMTTAAKRSYRVHRTQ